MSSYAGNAIIAKAKSIYGKRLKQEDYHELLKFKSISEITGYLKRHNKYSNTLKDVDENSIHRGQLENLIRKSYFDNLVRIIKFVGTNDRKFYELDMIRREIDIILSSIRSIVSGDMRSSIRDLPLFFIQHASFDLEKVTKASTLEELLIELEDTRYYDVISLYNTNDPTEIRYTDIEHGLYAQYHNIAIERINMYFKGKTHRILTDIYQLKVEIENIIKIYRVKKFYNAETVDILKSIITENIRMSDKKLIELINLDNPDEILKVLSKSDFSMFKDSDDYIYIEYQAGRIKHNMAKRFMYYSDSPPIVYSVFLFLNEIEMTNIFNIIEGIRYDIGKEDIKRMLIY